MKKAALYVRVSTEEQKRHGISVDSQITALKAYCSDNNMKVYKIYNDAGISARKRYTKRPALLELIDDCENGKIDIILFTKLDRWFRSVGDYYEVQNKLDECKVPWQAIWEDYETVTSSGIFKVNIMLSVAQSEADRTSERIKQTFEYKRAKGEYVGGNKAPIGYKRDGKNHVFNEKEYDGTKAFFETYEATFSMKNAIEAAKEHGVIINSNIATRMLTHSNYYGITTTGAECPAYITKEQYDLFQQHRLRKVRTSRKNNKYIFSGMLKCGCCGCNLISGRTRQKRKDGTYSEYIYYSCRNHERYTNCSGASITEKFLENYLIDKLDEELSEYIVTCTFTSETDNAARISALKSKMKRIGDRYENDEITIDDYKAKTADIKAEIEELEKQPTRASYQLPSNWKDIYLELDIEHRHAFWLHILKHVEINGFSCKTPILFFK